MVLPARFHCFDIDLCIAGLAVSGSNVATMSTSMSPPLPELAEQRRRMALRNAIVSGELEGTKCTPVIARAVES